MRITDNIKKILFLVVALIPGFILAEETDEPEVIWQGGGNYVYREPGDIIMAQDLRKVKLRLWQKGNEKYFTIDDDRATHYDDYVKNPEYEKRGVLNLISGAEYILNTEKYGKIYVINADFNGDPLDYYSSEKKEKLGIIHPVTAKAVTTDKEGNLVTDSKKEAIRLTLYCIDDTNDYYAMYKGKRYEISESPAPKTFIRENDVHYYGINYNGTKYIFKMK